MLLSFNSNVPLNAQYSYTNEFKNNTTFQGKTRSEREFLRDVRQLRKWQEKEEKKLLKFLRDWADEPKNIFERFEFFLKKQWRKLKYK